MTNMCSLNVSDPDFCAFLFLSYYNRLLRFLRAPVWTEGVNSVWNECSSVWLLAPCVQYESLSWPRVKIGVGLATVCVTEAAERRLLCTLRCWVGVKMWTGALLWQKLQLMSWLSHGNKPQMWRCSNKLAATWALNYNIITSNHLV